MPAIGERLREARIRQKIEIADVETATKIRAKYLRALENEEFGLLPGSTFTKTFLRTYADYLGLDAQLLVEEYRVEHEPRGEEIAPISAARTPRRPRRGGGGGRGPRVGPPGPAAVFGFVFVLLLAGILVLGLTADEEEPGGGGETTEQARKGDATRRERARERRAARRRAAARRRRREEDRSFVRLQLAPQEPIYACVVDGAGKQLFGGTLQRTRNFRARRIRVNLGRTSIRMTVNGDRLRIAPSSNPVGYDLRPGRRPRSLPLGQRPNC